MESVPRNVILDLLPAYIAGEASAESRALVEAFAKDDPQIAAMINSGKLDPALMPEKPAAPDDLEMKTMKRVRRSIRRRMWFVGLATAAILMIPFTAMQFSGEVNWTAFDFIVAAVLLLGTGFTYVLISRLSDNYSYRLAVGIAVLTGLLLAWVNLAVGIIGAEDNPANTLYFAVLLIGIIGAVIARLQPRGMSNALFATAGAQFLVPLIAMLIWRPSLENPPGIIGVFMLSAFFALLFAVSGLLFRKAAGRGDGVTG